jgi:hypothetical protein
MKEWLSAHIWFLPFVILLILSLVGIVAGWGAGKRQSQAESLVGQVVTLKAAVNNFFIDQGRFPTSVEFNDRGALGVYVNALPDKVPNTGCANNFIYREGPLGRPEFFVCMPTHIAGFSQGWNTVSLP